MNEIQINDLHIELKNVKSKITCYELYKEFSTCEKEIEAYNIAIKDLEATMISIKVTIKNGIASQEKENAQFLIDLFQEVA